MKIRTKTFGIEIRRVKSVCVYVCLGGRVFLLFFIKSRITLYEELKSLKVLSEKLRVLNGKRGGGMKGGEKKKNKKKKKEKRGKEKEKDRGTIRRSKEE